MDCNNTYLYLFFLQTLKTRAIVIVRSFKTSLARQPREHKFTEDPRFGKVKLGKDDVIHNVVTEESALRKADGSLWRGPKEKCVSLLQLFMTTFSPTGGIVVDLTAGTGRFIELKIWIFQLLFHSTFSF